MEPPIVIVTPSETAAADDVNGSAAREADLFASGKSARQLQVEAQKNEHDRNEKFKWHFETISIIVLYLVFVAVTAMAIVFVWHVVSPPHLQWLDKDQVQRVKDFVTGGLIIGILTDHFRKRLR